MTSEVSSELLSDDERIAWQAALSTADGLRALVNSEFGPSTGLSSADFLVLTRLKVAPEYRMAGLKALAAKLDWSPSRLSHHLRRMKTRGLVELVHESGGQLVVSATENAQQVMETASVLHARAVRHPHRQRAGWWSHALARGRGLRERRSGRSGTRLSRSCTGSPHTSRPRGSHWNS